jgi:large subunit ribosomal protein L25
MKPQEILARARTEVGTRACRKLRRTGEIPANLYRAKKHEGAATSIENTNLALPAFELMNLIATQQTLLEVKFSGNTQLALLQEVQRDALGDDVVHVDLKAIEENEPVTVEVALTLKGEPSGVKKGGQLRVEMRRLEVSCLPRQIPDHIDVLVAGLEMEQSLFVRDLDLPAGVSAISGEDHMVVHVVPPPSEEELDAAEESTAEPEVIAKGKKEEEEG